MLIGAEAYKDKEPRTAFVSNIDYNVTSEKLTEIFAKVIFVISKFNYIISPLSTVKCSNL